jgi:hypothetical protein
MAARAATSLRAKLAIPHHFRTEGTTMSAAGFAADLKKRRIPFHEMKAGDTVTFTGSRMLTR